MCDIRVSQIKNNIDIIQSRIEQAADKSGRDASSISLMAVSKTKPVEDIIAAYNAGQRLFGENRIQEAYTKFQEIPDDAQLHMIGHLQSNKSKTAASCAVCVQSIDKLKTAVELNRHAASLNKKIDILIEFNTSGESSKNGYGNYDNFLFDLEDMLNLENIRLRGLMTIAPFTDDEKEIRKSFRMLSNYFAKLKNDSGAGTEIDTLSMGMSSDYEIAIDEGSTLVRIGTAIFGGRNY